MNLVEETLIELQSLGHSQCNIERILGLPQQTLSKDQESPEVITLMKILKLYPWILNVAEGRFDQDIAKKELYQAVGEHFLTEASKIHKTAE